MKAHDWEMPNLLHQHSNIKFVQLDRRGPDTPVIERFIIKSEPSWIHKLIVLASTVILGWAFIGLYQGWL